jgi:hypothetical protein
MMTLTAVVSLDILSPVSGFQTILTRSGSYLSIARYLSRARLQGRGQWVKPRYSHIAGKVPTM